MSLGERPVVLTLSPHDLLRLEVLLADQDPSEALTFLRELYQKLQEQAHRGIKSHLDR